MVGSDKTGNGFQMYVDIVCFQYAITICYYTQMDEEVHAQETFTLNSLGCGKFAIYFLII